MTDYRFEDFTETGYREALQLASGYWSFESFGTTAQTPHVLWRHDVDISPNRALRLAEVESELGLRATYFFLLHSEFYNCLESSTRDVVRRIVSYGHDVGLHFDVGFYTETSNVPALEERIAFEASVVADLAGTRLAAVSFHNPTTEQMSSYDQPMLAGLVNAYGRQLKTYRYASDSNGYWRFDRLHDVLSRRADARLHVLTHPEWWTPDRLSPRDRVARAVEGRAARVMRDYDGFLAGQGRENVR